MTSTYDACFKKLWQECEEGCKSVFKEMDDVQKEMEINRAHYKLEYTMAPY